MPDDVQRRELLMGAAVLLGSMQIGRASDRGSEPASARGRPAVPRPVWCYEADAALDQDIPHGKTPGDPTYAEFGPSAIEAGR